jgi:hypothetical protein
MPMVSAWLTLIISPLLRHLAIRIDSTFDSCFGGTNGTLRDSAYGGVGPYTISWTPGGNHPLSGLGAGTYRVLVTDANGCTYN